LFGNYVKGGVNMLTKNWRIVLLLAALVFNIWPNLWAGFSNWVIIVALVILLVGELSAPTKGKK